MNRRIARTKTEREIPKGRKPETETVKREFDELSGRVIAAAIEVHKRLGPGFVEGVYDQALRIELANRGIAFESQKEIVVTYAGRPVGRHVLDMLINAVLVVELKAVASLEPAHFAQVKSYLRASGARVGLLINFAGTTLEVRRVVLRFEGPHTDAS